MHESIYDTFLQRLCETLRSAVIGDPMLPETNCGPMTAVELRDNLVRQVRESVEMGAQLV